MIAKYFCNVPSHLRLGGKSRGVDLDALSREELIAIVREAFSAIEALQATVAELKERVEALEEENARLRKGPPDGTLPPLRRQLPAGFQPKVRKKRGRGYSRMLEAPTQVRIHAAESCPDCGRKLVGGWLHHHRQVIEIPVARYQVIEHQISARHCGVCGKRVLPKANCIPDAVTGCRMGPRLTALVSYLKMRCRVPLRMIQALIPDSVRPQGQPWRAHRDVAPGGRIWQASLPAASGRSAWQPRRLRR